MLIVSRLKALLAETDAATIRDSLLELRQRHLPNGLLAALDTNGGVIAWTDSLTSSGVADVEARWVRPALAEGAATGTLGVADRVFHAAAVPVEAAGSVFGFLLAAEPIDDVYAQDLRETGRDEVVILGETGVLASTMLRDRLPWRNAKGSRGADAASPVPFEVILDGERYTALSVPTAPGVPLVAMTLQSRDQALAPYRRIQLGLLLLGAGRGRRHRRQRDAGPVHHRPGRAPGRGHARGRRGQLRLQAGRRPRRRDRRPGARRSTR